MNSVFVENYSILTGLGRNIGENFSSILAGGCSINTEDFHEGRISLSRIKSDVIDLYSFKKMYISRLEKHLIFSIEDALLSSSVDPGDPSTIFLISTTKGNIDNLDKADPFKIDSGRIRLHEMAQFISSYFGNPNRPVVICNACISGLSAIITAKYLITGGKYKNAIVCGGDVISEFVSSGFSALKAVSAEPSRPFDESRNGLSLGEACGTLILTGENRSKVEIAVAGCASSNDANHISGPSRDGGGLLLAIEAAMSEASADAGDVTSISAHGTGTVFNDEMESIAFERAGLSNVPVYSLKGFFGHTLGAAGIIESVLSIHAMKENIILPSGGYSKSGVSGKISISSEYQNSENNMCLKTGSGFGGCNAGVVFKKNV